MESEPNVSIKAPIIAGIDNKKEYRPAVSRSSFKKSATEMVEPDREIPGMMASPCTTPIPIASLSVIYLMERPVNGIFRVIHSNVPVTNSITPTMPTPANS